MPRAPLKADPKAEPSTETVYVALTDEDVSVYRPVEALPEGNDTYRLPEYQPQDERWAFPPGALVRCELRALNDGDRLVAVAAAG